MVENVLEAATKTGDRSASGRFAGTSTLTAGGAGFGQSDHTFERSFQL
jgi:hypothetical protein